MVWIQQMRQIHRVQMLLGLCQMVFTSKVNLHKTTPASKKIGRAQPVLIPRARAKYARGKYKIDTRRESISH